MEKIKLNLCSLGDPTSPKTWSGTSYNIYSELIKADSLGSTFNYKAVNNRYISKVMNSLSYTYYGKTIDLERGMLWRYLNANKVKTVTQNSISKHTLHMGTYGLPFLKKDKNQKHYLYSDSTWNLWSTYATDMQGYSARLLKDAEKLEREAYEQMDHIFPISEYVKNNLIEHYNINPGKITVAGTGTGVIKPFWGTKDYTNGKILFAAKGRFEDKGGPLVLEAFRIASQINPALELTIVGQNDYTNKIKAPSVTTHGFIAIEELQHIFNSNSLFLMPAINEPWGLVYLEALTCKMPIVGLNLNSFPEISGYGKYGFGLDSADPEKLAEIIVNAFANPEVLQHMGEQAQQYCLNRYTWSNTVHTILQTIQHT